MSGNPLLVRYDRPNTKNGPPFFDRSTRNCVLIPNMLIFLESGELGESSSVLKILILVYGKKSNFRGGTQSLCIKSERTQVGTIMFRSGHGVQWYQVYPDSLPP